MSVIQNNLLMTPEGYQISRSVRLRSSASAYFSRTPAGAGTSNKTFTYSGWVKRGSLGSIQNLISSPNTGNSDSLRFSSADKLEYNWQDTVLGQVTTTQVFRDPSAWYHIVFAMDTTQATASNRFKLYVNGVQVTAFDTASYPAQNTVVNNTAAVATKLGQYANSSAQSFDGYLTEVNFIDGQALTPSSFGETDAVTGVWKPKKYAGTYGTNGFYLNFSDNSNNTAATIGKDSSGNGNNWTPNNISVTSGVTYDSMLDVPTPYADGGNGRGNYAVLNPIVRTDSGSANTLSEGNLRANFTSNSYGDTSFATIPVSSGKWYAEFTLSNASYPSVEIFNMNYPPNFGSSGNGRASLSAYGYGYLYNGNKQNSGSASSYGSTIATGDVIGIALDMDNGKVFFSKNGTWQASGDPAAGTNAAFTGLSGNFAIGFCDSQTVSYSRANFGQRPFAYTPPTGFKALNTQNLPDATIKKGNQYFDATLYTGNASTQTIVNAGGFQPDFVWTKSRSQAYSHMLFDSSRGVNQVLATNNTAADTLVAGTLTSFNSNGFSVGANENGNFTNLATAVAWQWKKGATPGFDIVTYTGDGTTAGNRTIAHSLGATPSFIITKKRSGGTDYGWSTWHKAFPADGVWLNSTSGKNALMWDGYTNFSSSVFTPPDLLYGNESGATYVNYLWAEVAGFSKFGSYTGNGSADGPFVYCGFRPRFVMVKRTDTTGNWVMHDTSRPNYNATSYELYPNLSLAEGTSNGPDKLANGFKLRDTYADVNSSGGTYIFMAFAENPTKYALAR